MDIPGNRMLIENVPEEHFNQRDVKLVACVLRDYAQVRHTTPPYEFIVTQEEVNALHSMFGYEIDYLKITKQRFMSHLMPPYSLASQHPRLVELMWRMFTGSTEYQEQLLNRHPKVLAA